MFLPPATSMSGSPAIGTPGAEVAEQLVSAFAISRLNYDNATLP